MAVAAAIKFVQGATVGTPGVALMGADGTNVVCSNGNDSGVISHLCTVVDSPPGSSVLIGTTGTGATFTFDPDIPGGFLISLFVVGADGSEATDVRCFGVPQASGRFIPPFSGDSGSLNFSGTTLGWDPIMRVWLLYLDSLAGGGSATEVTASQILPPGLDVVAMVDTNGGAVTMTANATSADGNLITVLDVGQVTTGVKYWRVQDANGYKFEDPDQPGTFTTTYMVTSPRNLSWRRGTCTRTSTTSWFAS